MPSKYQRDRQKRDLEDHRKRLKNTTSFLDTRPPREMPMSNRAEMARRTKQAMVNFDNRLLLDRIAAAMNTTNVDNKLVAKPFISVLELQRKKELRKVVAENHHLLHRIQVTVPTYDHVKWKKEAEKHVDILRNMSDFPEYFVPPGEHKKGYDMAIVDLERQREKMLKQAFKKSLNNSPAKDHHNDQSKVLSRTGGSAISPPSQYPLSHSPPMNNSNSRSSISSGGQAKPTFSERDYQKYVQKLRDQLQQARGSSSSSLQHMPRNNDASGSHNDNTAYLHRDTAYPYGMPQREQQPPPHQYALSSYPSMHDDYDLEQDFSRNMTIQDFGR